MTGPSTVDPRDDGRISELETRIAELEGELAGARERSAAMRRRLDRDIDRSRRLVRDRERALAEANANLTRLRNRRVVRLGVAVLRMVRKPKQLAADGAARLRGTAKGVAGRAGLVRFLQRNAGLSEAEFVARLLASLPVAPSGMAQSRITAIVDSRSDSATLRRCLEGLQETDWDDLEILVAGPKADNLVRAATRGDQRSTGGLRRIRPVTGGTAADSRREAFAISTGALVLFVHDDVEPIEPGWLKRMVATLRDEAVGAVGARLLLPRGAGDRTSGMRELTVAHAGVEFVAVDGIPEARAIGLGEDPLGPGQAGRSERPATSEACLLIERTIVDEVGLPPSAVDEAEPVELVLRIRESGRSIVVDGSAVLWHRGARTEGSPRHPVPVGEVSSLADQWGPLLYRSVLLDRLAGEGRWSSIPLRVGITLTRDDETAGYGDWYTAHELGEALGRLGWEIRYLERDRDRWYEDAGQCDVIVSLLERFDLFRIPRHVVSVAWIRNWTEEWTAKPWFDNYDLVLASSARSKAIVEEQSAKVAHVFPIATNPARFHPRPATTKLASDAAFVGSYWGVERGVGAALPELAAAGHRVAVFGRGWEGQPGVGELSRGLLPYDAVPDVYASTAIALDDAAVSTKPYGSLNSRVFDALATGTLVVTDNVLGARELFDDEFPVWDEPDDLVTLVGGLLADPARRSALAARYRQVVLERHTYDHRAAELRSLLAAWATAPKIAAHIGPKTWEMGRTWGDVPFGRDLQRNLERRGYSTAVLVNAEATSAAAIRADVAIHVFGVRAPRTIRSQLNALWVISHPDRVTEALCETYDVVFSASDLLLDHLSRRIDARLVSLHQATEPSRFFPDPSGPRHELLFIGNSRGVQRPIIEDLRGTQRDLAVYGGGWTPELLDPKHLRGEWVPNGELRTYYSSAEIVLNDHWGDMRDLGIISNRVYDALACGAFVISDRVRGIDEEFDGGVVTYETPAELHELIERYLADPEARERTAQRGRAAVLARHTFAQRVDLILEVVGPLIAERSLRVGSARTRADDAGADGAGVGRELESARVT